MDKHEAAALSREWAVRSALVSPAFRSVSVAFKRRGSGRLRWVGVLVEGDAEAGYRTIMGSWQVKRLLG